MIDKDIQNKLDNIVKNHGIDVIRDYVKNYNKKSRRNSKKGNKQDEVAIDVYNLVMSGEYDLAHAIIEVGIQRHTSDSTVKNQKDAFYQQAKKDYLEAYEYHLRRYINGDNFVGINYDTSWDDYNDELHEHYSTEYVHMKNYTYEKLKVYYYLFNKVFVSKKDIKEKMKKMNKLKQDISNIPF